MVAFPSDIPKEGKLAENIIYFSRALRRAGVPVGPSRVINAIRAVEAAGFTRKQDFYYTLQACFISRPEHRQIFGQVFRLFWRDPKFLEHMMSMMLPSVRGVNEAPKPKDAERRATEALLDGQFPEQEQEEEKGEEIEFDAAFTFSANEQLRHMDFEQMSTAEITEAKRAIAALDLNIRPLQSRRTKAASHGHIPDWRRSFAQSMRRGGEMSAIARKSRRERYPNLVALCDISGSMASYSRMLLHFLHTASNAKGAGWAAVHAFTFGTKLTNITRAIRMRDVDTALKIAGQDANDWEGGTRIGACLEAFNKDWSRRVLGQGAIVLLITDGLDQGDCDALERQAERLGLSARRLVWVNPLLRWDQFTPKARGIRAILPHVHSFRAGHNIASLEALSYILCNIEESGDKDRLMRML